MATENNLYFCSKCEYTQNSDPMGKMCPKCKKAMLHLDVGAPDVKRGDVILEEDETSEVRGVIISSGDNKTLFLYLKVIDPKKGYVYFSRTLEDYRHAVSLGTIINKTKRREKNLEVFK